MTRNQLPDGVGKKIVEALKRQAEADITPVNDSNNSIDNSLPLNQIDDIEELQFDGTENELESFDNLIIEEEPNSTLSEVQQNENIQPQQTIPQTNNNVINETQYSQPINNNTVENSVSYTPIQEINQEINPKIITPANVNQIKEQVNISLKRNLSSAATGKINIPENVATLRNLIATLPVGVTKQTGAQIIRQTLEAMGIPMNGVLKEAQDVQEELNSTSKECMLRIQEYKTNILQLEQSVQEYQRTINQINDLVSLFLMTEK